jgi:hypothetical protein
MTMTHHTRPVQIRAGSALIEGDLAIPERAAGLVVFAHGSGSSRFSRRNRMVAQALEEGGFATLLLDLLTRKEEAIDVRTREYRFDIDRLAHRVVAAIDWAGGESEVSALPMPASGRAPARRRRSGPQPSAPTPYALSFRGAAGPTSPATPCRASRLRPCSSSAAPTRW